MAAEATSVNDVMRILLEDRRNRELLIEDKRRQRGRAIAEESEQLREQMDVLRRLVEGSQQDHGCRGRETSKGLLHGRTAG